MRNHENLSMKSNSCRTLYKKKPKGKKSKELTLKAVCHANCDNLNEDIYIMTGPGGPSMSLICKHTI